MNLQLHYYLLCVSKLLPHKGKEKRNVMNFVKENLLECLAENQFCFKEVRTRIGSPEAFVLRFLPEGVPPKKRFLGSKPILRLLMLTIGWIAVLLGLFFLAIFLMQHFAPALPLHKA